jgi:isopentenyl phosphate kinase
LLELNLLPVVYGDVVMDESRGCSIISTEKILNHLALKLRSKYQVDRIIFCGITDGVYSGDGTTISRITGKNIGKFSKDIRGSEGIDVTGGMEHKINEALKIARKGIPTLIINGKRKNALTNCILKDEFIGTTIG